MLNITSVFIPTFGVYTVISGKVQVTIHTQKKTGNGTKFLVSLDPTNIAEIVHHVKKTLRMPDFVKVKGREVRVMTEGQCEFNYAVKQHVRTSTEGSDEW